MLRHFNQTHIDEDCRDITGSHYNELFFNCAFDKLNGLVLQDCDLNQSQFLTSKVEDALGFTLTLNCHSFKDVTLSPLLFDLMLILLVMSKSNDAKREALLDVIGRRRAEALLRLLERVE